MNNETQALATTPTVEIQPANLLQAIMHVATTPNLNMDTLERLMAMQERMEDKHRQQVFASALARLQAELPLIYKGGTNKHTGTKYARREDIQAVIQPLLSKYGFAFSFNEEDAEGDMKKFSAKLSHEDGYSETKSLKVPVDKAATNSSGKPVRTGIQDMGSTASYAIRYLIKMHLNIAETEEDNDGNSVEKITADQARDLQISAEEAGINGPRFLVFMNVGSWEDILASDLKKAVNAIEVRRKENAGKK